MSGLTNLTTLNLDNNSISSISAVSGLTNLTTLRLDNNSISDISPLVSNTGLGAGDTLTLDANPLSYPSIYTHIPALKARVGFSFTNRVPTTLMKVSGDAQTGATSTALTNPFVVEVKDGATPAKGFEGVPVTFVVTGGGGTLNATSVTTNATGQAQVTLTPGATAGMNTVTAIVVHAGRTLSVYFTSEVDVNIPDANLRRVINRALGASRAATAAVAGTEMRRLASLAARSASISNLTGLEEATHLTTLDLVSNSLSDISALSGLTNLTTLRLGSNSITSLSSVSGLTNLTTLGLLNNSISDISPLVSNTGLGTGDTVNLGSNPLSYPAIYTHIPALQTRGVTVLFDNRVPTTLTKVSGDAQTGEPSTALTNPFVVEVKDGATTAKTFAGVPVTFAVTAGGGTLSATSVATDTTGRAQVTLTPGTTAVTQTVTATVTHSGQTLTQTFTATVNNIPPTFTSAATFSVVENTTAVGTVVATDANSQDSVTGYTLSGADSAKFSITNAGVLTFIASPDYDAPGDLVSTEPANAAGNNEYVIVVTATSGSGARQTTATQTLTITVTNVVDEAPGKPAVPTVTTVAATPTSLNVTWAAPTNAGSAITAYNLRYRKNSEPSWTPSNYAGTDTVDISLTGLAGGNTYEVQVLAKNVEGDSPWSNSGTGTTAYHPEDIDSDGDVDMADLVSVVNNFGSASPGRNDVDGDNDVDAADIRAVFAAMLAGRAAAAPPHVARTTETLQAYVQQSKQDGMLDVNLQRGLAVLEELLEPFLMPEETVLLRNYPNPFNPETWFPYELSSSADVTFAIYSVNGTLVRLLSLGYQSAGVYRSQGRAAYWDGRNALGESVASGIYFYTFTAGEFSATGKLLIRK